MNKDIPSWADFLCGIVRADARYREWPRIEVVFVGRATKVGIDIFSGAITTGDTGTCFIRADEAILESIACGETTLQSAHNAGRAELAGDPAHLLRLALLFDEARSLSKNSCRVSMVHEIGG